MVEYGNTYPLMIRTLNLDLISLPWSNSRRAVFLGWQSQCENTKLVLLGVVLCAVPIIEVAKLYEQERDAE